MGLEVAGLLGTTERFPRRLVAERCIAYVKDGRHVRIPEKVVREYIDTNTVRPVGLGGAASEGLTDGQ
ncbi:excisionase family DNA-binding protein [Streptomyces solisilvae]|uniref:excisionase family DNA-binding protein n=1 Tax=Streptomyces malaysiensis TaxID=92644 RepID=UPI00369A1E2D